jgi:hypothetical protein
MVTAISMLVLHRRAHDVLSDGLREQHPVELRRWEAMVTDWERDGSNPSPYAYAGERESMLLPTYAALTCFSLTGLTMSQLKQTLVLENEATASDGHAQSTATASSFLLAIVEIQDMQCVCFLSLPRRALTTH